MIDFSNCIVDNTKGFNGANGSKISIIYENKAYILKFRPQKNNIYSNGHYSEYVGAHIANYLGYEAHQTLLGTYNGQDVVALLDFAPDKEKIKLYDFASLKNQIIDSKRNGYGTELNDIMTSFKEQTLFDKIKIEKYFWDTFMLDSLLGNFDRHNGNWGYIKNLETNEVKLSPRFDFGSCLYPKAQNKDIQNIMQNEEEINKRIYQFPNSAIKIDDKKINYFEFLQDIDKMPPMCKACLFSFVEKVKQIDLKEYIMTNQDFQEIPQERKEFYATMLESRFEKILLPAYEKLQNKFIKNLLVETENGDTLITKLIKPEWFEALSNSLIKENLNFSFLKDQNKNILLFLKEEDTEKFLQIQKDFFDSIGAETQLEQINTKNIEISPEIILEDIERE